MKYGLFSGIFWALDTVLLGIALSLVLPGDDFLNVLWLIPVAGAFLHDWFSALWLLCLTVAKKRLKQLKDALQTKHGLAVVIAALLGGPVGMTGYMLAIKYIGPGYTACISAFYLAFGALLARVVLKERLSLGQYMSFAVALLGVMGIGYLSSSNSIVNDPLLGFISALVCVVGWGSEAVLGSYAMRHALIDNQIALQIRNGISSLIYALVVIPLLGISDLIIEGFTTNNYLFVSLCAGVGTLSYLFYYKAIDSIGPSRGMALNISYAAWALILSVFILHYVPSFLEWVCCGMILVGTIFSANSWKSILKKQLF